jgi:hypothetical protein
MMADDASRVKLWASKRAIEKLFSSATDEDVGESIRL